MATIPAGISLFVFAGTTPVTLSTATWRTNVRAVYKINPAHSGWLNFKPASGFPTVTQLQQDAFYLVDCITSFDLTDAQTVASSTPKIAAPVITTTTPNISGATVTFASPGAPVGTTYFATLNNVAIGAVTSPYSITNQQPNTSIDFEVVAKCTGFLDSDAGVSNFTTAILSSAKKVGINNFGNSLTDELGTTGRNASFSNPVVYSELGFAKTAYNRIVSAGGTNVYSFYRHGFPGKTAEWFLENEAQTIIDSWDASVTDQIIVTLEFCPNDIGSGTLPQAIFDNLVAISNMAKTSGAAKGIDVKTICCLGMPNNNNPSYTPIFNVLRMQLNALIINSNGVFDGIVDAREFPNMYYETACLDPWFFKYGDVDGLSGIHWNDAGHQLIGEAEARTVSRLLNVTLPAFVPMVDPSDISGPVVQQAIVTNDKRNIISIKYDKILDIASGLSVSDLIVPGNTVSSIAFDGIYLNVSVLNPFLFTDIITISGGNSKIRDFAKRYNDFEAQMVTNQQSQSNFTPTSSQYITIDGTMFTGSNTNAYGVDATPRSGNITLQAQYNESGENVGIIALDDNSANLDFRFTKYQLYPYYDSGANTNTYIWSYNSGQGTNSGVPVLAGDKYSLRRDIVSRKVYAELIRSGATNSSVIHEFTQLFEGAAYSKIFLPAVNGIILSPTLSIQ